MIPKKRDYSVLENEGDRLEIKRVGGKYKVVKWIDGKVDESYRPLSKCEVGELLKKSLS